MRSKDGTLKYTWVPEKHLQVKPYYIDNASVVEAARHAGLLRCGSTPGMLKHGVPELVFRYHQYRRHVDYALKHAIP